MTFFGRAATFFGGHLDDPAAIGSQPDKAHSPETEDSEGQRP